MLEVLGPYERAVLLAFVVWAVGVSLVLLSRDPSDLPDA